MPIGSPILWASVTAIAVFVGCGSRVSDQDAAVDGPPAVQAVTGQDDPLAARSKGAPTAPVTVYEMSDFQCPYCRRHAIETFPAIEREYIETGKVRWVFINFPLTSIHDNAAAAAEFALCAAEQDRFWPAHDVLFRQQQVWAPLADPGPYLLTLADSIGASRDTLLACLQDPATREAVRRDAEGAARAGANSTPTFYIEGGILEGAYPIDIFRQVLDSIHAAKTER